MKTNGPSSTTKKITTRNSPTRLSENFRRYWFPAINHVTRPPRSPYHVPRGTAFRSMLPAGPCSPRDRPRSTPFPAGPRSVPRGTMFPAGSCSPRDRVRNPARISPTMTPRDLVPEPCSDRPRSPRDRNPAHVPCGIAIPQDYFPAGTCSGVCSATFRGLLLKMERCGRPRAYSRPFQQ